MPVCNVSISSSPKSIYHIFTQLEKKLLLVYRKVQEISLCFFPPLSYIVSTFDLWITRQFLGCRAFHFKVDDHLYDAHRKHFVHSLCPKTCLTNCWYANSLSSLKAVERAREKLNNKVFETQKHSQIQCCWNSVSDAVLLTPHLSSRPQKKKGHTYFFFCWEKNTRSFSKLTHG